MALSQKLAAAALGILLMGGVATSGQGNKVPGPDLAGMADTKGMHTAIIRAIEANTRAQIVIARLASQDARVAAAIAQVADAQRQAAEAAEALVDAEAETRRLNDSLSGQSGEVRTMILKAISENRAELPELRRQRDAMRAQIPKVQQALAAEQKQRTELSGRLDELERSLPLR